MISNVSLPQICRADAIVDRSDPASSSAVVKPHLLTEFCRSLYSSSYLAHDNLFSKKASSPEFSRKVEQDLLTLGELHNRVRQGDTSSYLDIDRLYQAALTDFSFDDDHLSRMRNQMKQCYPNAARKFFQAGVGHVMFVNGWLGDHPVAPNTLRASLYKDPTDAQGEGRRSTSILESRAPYIAPHLLASFHHRDNCETSISQWIRNYTRSNGNPSYAMMSERERENLETTIIGRKEVPYFSGKALADKELKIKDGLLLDHHGFPASTASYRTNEAGVGYGTLIMTQDNKLYCYTHKKNELHHTSITAGRAVLFAGEVRLANGKIVGLTSKTGHYKTPAAVAKQFVQYLSENGISHPPLRDFSRVADPIFHVGEDCSALMSSYCAHLPKDGGATISAGDKHIAETRLNEAFPIVLSPGLQLKLMRNQQVPNLENIFDLSNPYGLAEDEIDLLKNRTITMSHRLVLSDAGRQAAEVFVQDGCLVNAEGQPVDSLYYNERSREEFAFLIKQGVRLFMARAEPVIDSLSLSRGNPVEYSVRAKIVQGRIQELKFDDIYYPVATEKVALLRSEIMSLNAHDTGNWEAGQEAEL